MRIALASDHAGFELKKPLRLYLRDLGHEPEDLGCHDTASVDYPDYALKVARGVAEGRYDRGLLICGTGLGMSIAANKVKGVRAALCLNEFMARMSREHNDARVLCLPGRVIGTELAKEITRAFLEAEFAGGRHQRRLDKISAIEEVG